MRLLSDFAADERGAANIDWVTLTGAVLLLGIAVVFVIFAKGVSPLVADINETAVEGVPDSF